MEVDAPMDALLGSLGLPTSASEALGRRTRGGSALHRAPGRENGGAPSKTRAILTAIPAEMKPFVDRAILAAAEAAAASRQFPV